MIIPLLHRVTEGLEKFSIPYMLSGSVAMSVYTLPRMTMDIDIIIELSYSNVEAFLSIFKENYYIDHTSVINEIKRNGMFNVIDHKSGFKVDFLVKKVNTEYLNLQESREKILEVKKFG